MTTMTSPRARALSAALREARKTSGIGLRELGRMLRISPTDISHWESGARVPRLETVALILGVLRTSPDERAHILNLARGARERTWLTVGEDGIPAQMAGVVECERQASAITLWEPNYVPGLLQTSDYTRTIMSAGNRLGADDVALRTMIHSSRCEVITRRHDPVPLHALIGEVGLTEPIGPPEVMPGQLRHLAAMAERPNVALCVVPRGVGWHPGLMGPFILFDFADAPTVLYLEHHSSGAFIPTEHDVSAYRRVVDWLRELAWSPDESSAFIAELAGEPTKRE
jgi:transcriptional regulator with XRE-family HTH domain